MKHSRRDIRTERQARDLAKRFGWGTPMPEREDGEPGEEPVQDERTPVGPFDCGADAQAGAA
ncbi:hypothetical protein [Rhizobacter sp. OV335]|uniref:hypothetical protein n=1 Tax=Rhizobacter sp. OV335 TaxID=1500264 RepID=UPI000922B511|nr:hypothetical protein [Rhizobacter sp. OV335]SHN40410.1 hypothetical protein SAMN02787076_06243 [Rhizobacter sp. OV335]